MLMKTTKSASRRAAAFPVSEKFYTETVSRIHDSFRSVASADSSLAEETVRVVEAYLLEGILPDETSDQAVRLMFALLKTELDKAMARSAAARSRRRGKQNAEKPEKIGKAGESGFDMERMARMAELLGVAMPSVDDLFKDETPEAEEPAEAPAILMNRRQRRRQERENRRRQRSGASRTMQRQGKK